MNTKFFTKSSISTLIDIVEKNIKNDKYDYIVNHTDTEFSEVHIVETADDKNSLLKGWHLWLIKDPECWDCCLVQTINNEYGLDHHCLTEEEMYYFFKFFTGNNYNICKK